LKRLKIESEQLEQEDENLLKKIAELEKELHDIKIQKKKLNAASAPKKEKKLSNFKNILQYNIDNALPPEFVYKMLTTEIENFCNYIRAETAKVEKSRKYVIEQISTLIAESFSGYNVRNYKEVDN